MNSWAVFAYFRHTSFAVLSSKSSRATTVAGHDSQAWASASYVQFTLFTFAAVDRSPARLSDDVTSRVRQLGLVRRGRRGGRSVRARQQRSPPVLRPVGNGAYTALPVVHSLVGLLPEVAVVR